MLYNVDSRSKKKLYCCRPSFNLDTACTDQNQVPARRQDRTRPRPAQPGAAPPSTTAVRSSCNTQCPIRQYQKKNSCWRIRKKYILWSTGNAYLLLKLTIWSVSSHFLNNEATLSSAISPLCTQVGVLILDLYRALCMYYAHMFFFLCGRVLCRAFRGGSVNLGVQFTQS